MTADTTMTDVDTDEGGCYECGSDLLEKPFLRGVPNPGPVCPVCNPDIVLKTLEHERSRYDELKKLQNVTSELWQSAERERDELERLAGDALAELEADLKVITHAFAEIDKLPMNGELIGLHSILLHSKDKRIPRAVAALEAYQRKGE